MGWLSRYAQRVRHVGNAQARCNPRLGASKETLSEKQTACYRSYAADQGSPAWPCFTGLKNLAAGSNLNLTEPSI